MIIFVNKVDRAKKLTELLRQKLFNPICIHSQLKQEERIKNYDLFKANGSRLLVATDLFGRGIDIERVNLVINYGKGGLMQTSLRKETPTCTGWAERAVSGPRVWRSTSSELTRRRARRIRLTSRCCWTCRTASRLRFWSCPRNWILLYTCDLFGAIDPPFLEPARNGDSGLAFDLIALQDKRRS
jgi:hypothetical protein